MTSETFVPTDVVYHLAEQAKSRGVKLRQAPGPWSAGERQMTRPGRRSLHTVPIVTNEQTAVMVDTAEHALDVAGLLNWCGLRELEPVAALVAPTDRVERL